jgi:hypothetical protein
MLRSIPEFLETLKLLHVHGPLPGRSLCSMSCSGGEASLIADAAVDRDLTFRPLTAEERAGVKATLGEMVAVANPLDYHTFIWDDEPAMAATFTAMIRVDAGEHAGIPVGGTDRARPRAAAGPGRGAGRRRGRRRHRRRLGAAGACASAAGDGRRH